MEHLEYRNDYNPMFTPQEVWATVEGIKPVTRKELDRDRTGEKELREFGRRFGLEVEVRELGRKGPSGEPDFVYISNSASEIEEAHRAEKKKNDQFLGRLLGYPSCCVERYKEDYTQHSVENERVRSIYSASEEFYPYNNVIYTFETRLTYSIDSDEMEKFMEVEGLNLYLNCHLPCSFGCDQSRKNAEELMDVLEEEEPELASRLKEVLSRPVLFLDDFRWMTFEGESGEDGIRYESVAEPYSLMDRSPFAEGDRVRTSGREVEIFQDGEKVNSIGTEREPVVLPFDG